ncbi:hypothetical protein TK90_1118 [Thioalkalivibrio sp. K90mix]|jgi:hypothetical protein|uniref:hypothetical protein n=1 Tax=Thioalkalivibrio sp. (strain K90mix) TaxID=396595 RepID=UPI0001C4E23A|nr:hypothetical protein [Thioalkalivibrio sp. K90mix]ADC71629.1 hypothetical protein TK90_1118 [Thioalkalivibrio sp. K90mix]
MKEIWDGSMDTVYYTSDEATLRAPCKVTIGRDQISVSYDLEGENYQYTGTADAPGHFILALANRPEETGGATLHRFPNSKLLEGYWEEGGVKGFWRIRLHEKVEPLGG